MYDNTSLLSFLQSELQQLEVLAGAEDDEARALLQQLEHQMQAMSLPAQQQPLTELQLAEQLDSLDTQLSQLEASVHAADAPTLELLGKSTSKWVPAAHMADPAPAGGDAPLSYHEDASHPVSSSSSTSDSDTASTDAAATTAAADSPAAPPGSVSSGSGGNRSDSSAVVKPASSSHDAAAPPSTHPDIVPNRCGSPAHQVVSTEQAAADQQHQGQVAAAAAEQHQGPVAVAAQQQVDVHPCQ